MNIRKVTRDDIGACVKVFMESYNCLPWNYNWKYDDAVNYLTEYMETKHFIGFVVCEDEKIVGAMFGHTKTWWTNNQLYIDELFVSAQSQGKGYGKKLIAETENYCRENEIEMITLMTNKFMPAIKFYNTIDFTKVDQYVFMFKQV